MSVRCAALMPAIVNALDDMFREYLPSERVQFYVVAYEPGNPQQQGAFGSNMPLHSLNPEQLIALRAAFNGVVDALERRCMPVGHA